MALTKVQGVFLKTTPQDEDHQVANLYSTGITDNAPSTLLTLTNEINAAANLNITGSITTTTGGFTNPVLDGEISGTAFLDDDTFGTANSTTAASSESIKAYVNAQVTAQTFNFSTASGSGTVDLDSQTLAFVDGSGIDITHTGLDLTVAVDTSVATSSDTLNFFSETSSTQLAGVISDNTGTGNLVFATSSVLTTPQINDADQSHQYIFAVSDLLANRTVTLPLLGASDTFVFANHSETLQNKTIDLTNNTLNATSLQILTAVSDNTGTGNLVFATSSVLTTPQINDTSQDHQYIFAVSELAANRTVTLPLLGASDTFVFANHSETLQNKTIDLTNNTLNATSQEMLTAVSDSTGTGALVFSNSPNVNTAITTSTTTTFNLINANATTVNFAGGATANVNIGGAGATVRTPGDIFRIDDAAGQIQINSIKVVGVQQSWTGTLTGTANTVPTLDTETAYAANNEIRYLAQHVKGIIDALRVHGLIS